MKKIKTEKVIISKEFNLWTETIGFVEFYSTFNY